MNLGLISFLRLFLGKESPPVVGGSGFVCLLRFGTEFPPALGQVGESESEETTRSGGSSLPAPVLRSGTVSFLGKEFPPAVGGTSGLDAFGGGFESLLLASLPEQLTLSSPEHSPCSCFAGVIVGTLFEGTDHWLLGVQADPE